jgi:hypothetical protein
MPRSLSAVESLVNYRSMELYCRAAAWQLEVMQRVDWFAFTGFIGESLAEIS